MDRLWCVLLAMLCVLGACSPRSSAEDSPIGFGDSRQDPGYELAFADGGGVLRLGLLRPDTFDPANVVLTDQSAVIVADLLYDGLTEAAAGSDSLRSGLAERWEANEDFTVWTFYLAQTTIDRGVDADLVVETLAPLTSEGASARRGGAAAAVSAGMHRVSAVDDRTVIVELATSNAGLPWVLSGLPFSVAGPDGLATGEYDVVSDDTNGMVLHRKAGQTSNSPREVRISWFADGGSSYEALERDAVDAAIVEPTTMGSIDERYSAAAKPTVATRFYVMNSRSPTLADSSARRAVLSAIDRGRLLSDGFEQGDSGVSVVPVDGLLAETIVGFEESARCGPTCSFDPEAPAGFATLADAPRIQLAYSGAEQAATADLIVEQLGKAGFAAEATELPPGALAAVIVAGETDLFAFGWVAPATSGDAVIPPLLTVDSPANIARVDSPAVAVLLAEAAVTADDQRRWGLLNDAHRAAMDQALIIPIAASVSMLIKSPEAGWIPVRADGSIDVEALDDSDSSEGG